MPATNHDETADGRVARSHRTNRHIVAALLELVERDGHLRPTAHQIARRAGVSRRGLYLHFESLEDLIATAADRRSREIQASWQAPPHDGPRAERIDWFCRRWAALLEVLNPVQRATAVHEPFSHAVAAVAERTRCWARDTVERVFHRELSTVPEAERASLVVALHHATSCRAWDDLRQHGCDPDEALRALHRLITALLDVRGPEPDAFVDIASPEQHSRGCS